MKSDLPKTLHKVAGVPMIRLIVDAMRGAGIGRIIVVVGHKGEEIQKELGAEVEYAWQKEQLGTGHAVTMTKSLLEGFEGAVVITPGDVPLLDKEVFEFVLASHGKSLLTMPTAIVPDPTGYGRIVRNPKGELLRIVEEKDASPDVKAIHEVNAGIYCFDGAALYDSLPSLRNTNASREYYLTDLVEILSHKKAPIKAVVYEKSEILIGVNDRWQLALAEKQFQQKILESHARAGVGILDIGSVYIGPYVKIGAGVTIEPGTVILGSTEIGAGCTIGPNTRIDSCDIGENSRIYMSHLQGAVVGKHVKCGPFANLRPDTVLKDGVKVGNFVEVKNAVLEAEVSVGHLAYIGDAEVGANTNVGAGVITCNYDGFRKNRTVIGADSFIGSNATLVAPISIGDHTVITAGSVITEDVPEGAGAFGRARQDTKPGWEEKWRKKMEGVQ